MPGESAPNPTPSENIDDIADFYASMPDPSVSKDESAVEGASNPSPEASVNPESTASESNHELSSEKLKEIESAMGHSALIATGYTKEDEKNVIREAIDLKTKETSNKNTFTKVVTRFPVIGSVVKAGIAAKHRRTALNAINESGDLSSAYDALGLDSANSRVLSGNSEATRERAWQTLENAGYSSDNQIDVAASRLDQNERVEKMDAETTQAVKQALNNYYTELKAGGDKNELSSKFDSAISEAFQGKENLSASIDLEQQKAGIEKLIENKAIEEQDIKTYLDSHVSLYKATMKEGIYTDQKVDSVISAVAAAGLAGGVIAALSGREGRRAMRSAIGGVASAAGAGAVVGGAFGAARGVNKAKVKLSEAETRAATTFEESATESAETESEEPEPELKEPERPTVSETADEKAWEDYYDAYQAFEAKLKAAEEAEAEATEAKPARAGVGAVLSGVNKFKRKLTGEDKYLAEIEELRDRKDASNLIENFDELISKLNPEDADSRQALIDAYADAIARGRFSSEKHIDLIKYKDGDKNSLEQKLHDVERALYGDDPNAINSLLDDENSDLNKLINGKKDELNDKFLEANKLRTKFIVRSALVDAAAGAVLGAGAGSVIGIIRDHTPEGGLAGILGLKDESTSTGEGLKADNIELTKDVDGGFTVKLGEQELIGEGDAKGIEFGSDGALTDESKEMLEGAGIHVEEDVTEHVFENATKSVSLREFFNPANKEANGLTEVTDRSWISDGTGRDMVTLGDTHMDGDGNIIMQVTARDGANVDMDNMKLLLTPGNGNIDTGITVDVNPDGTIEIPADSPAASLFDGDSYQGGYGELIQEGDNGHIDVFHTIGDGRADVNSITVDNPDATYNEYSYTFDVDGQQYEVEVPDEITESARLEALNGFESVKGTGEPIGYESNGEATNLTTSSGEAVEVEHFEHHGGYSDYTDSYFGEKEGVYNSGASVIRQMVGDEGNGLSSQEVDRIFLDKVNSGEIEEGDVVEEYLKTMGNSPEALTTTRAMMGDFKFDIDGDGTSELIDTQDEINMVSDIISRDPEAYDAFVNDTYDIFYDKIAGGNIRFVDYTQERYDYTTWGVLGEDNNILQRLGVTGDRPTDGVGIVFTDKNGNSIYDEETVRKLWHLPEGYNLEYVSDRLNCIQKTGRGIFEQKVTEEKTTSESTTKTTGEGTAKTTSEKSTSEKSTGEKTTEEKTTGEKSTDEKSTGEKSTDEKTTDEKSTGEKTTSEETIEPKDYENMERIDNNIDKDIEHDTGTNEIQHHTDLGTGEKTEQPSSSDYQGTEPKVVQNETSKPAAPVQEKVSEPNNYSNDNGGAHQAEHQPVKPEPAATEAADNRGDTAASSSEVDEVLEDVGIN